MSGFRLSLRTAATYAAILAAGTALFFFLHYVGNQTPYDAVRQRLADEFAVNAGPADERYFRGARPLISFEFCDLSRMALAGANRDGDERAITDAILLETFYKEFGASDGCAETRTLAEGGRLDKAFKKTRYWFGNKAALAIGLRWLSVLDYHRLISLATFGAWGALAAALAALGWRALIVGAPAIAFGIWLSGVAYFADAADGPAHIWAISSAAILALILRRRAPAKRAPIFCFAAGMVSSYLWFADGHNALAVFLLGLVAWLGYSRLNANDRARRAAGCVALWILGFATCFALMLTVKTAASELLGEYYKRNQEYYYEESAMGVAFIHIAARLRQAWSETRGGGGTG